MLKFRFWSLLLASLSVVVMGCSDDATAPSPDPEPRSLEPVILRDIVPDEEAGFFYFSFDREQEIAPADAATDKWDLKLGHMVNDGVATQRRIDILLNSGSVNAAGKTLGVLVPQSFDNVLEAPADSLFREDNIEDAHRIIRPSDFFGGGIFNYNMQTHTLNPNPQMTLVIKTAQGNFVKVQFVRLYPSSVETPDRYTPLGHFTLRYVIGNGRKLG